MPRETPRLSKSTNTSIMFLDESGSISNDRYFAVGCLKAGPPSSLTRQVQSYRDRKNFHAEFKFSAVTKNTLGYFKDLVDLTHASGATFSCFVADRDSADPVKRFGTTWAAYEKLACQLVIAAAKPGEISTVLADNYSTPATFDFESSVKTQVNRRLARLAITEVLRLDSRSADALQLVDILTGAVAYQYRAAAGQGGNASPKALLSQHVRDTYSVTDFIGGCTGPLISVREYEDENWRRRRRRPGQAM